ncbi:MAG: aminopeptidase N, partial [Enterobacteriaceae bacterium]
EYDLDIYMLVAVDFFNMGAMENKGLNVFNSKYVLARADTATDNDYLAIESVIGHEYFHNWTGNRVTCRDWFQLSLKEGLTVFRDQEFSSDLGSRAVNRINNVRIVRGLQFAEDASPLAHPVRPEKVMEMNNFYTMTVYEKGAEVIRMMHTLLGESGFQAGMRLYFERHDGCAVTCDDFVQAMQDASGVDLSQFRLWYSQSGTPQLTIRDHYDEHSRSYRLQVSQHTPPTADQAQKQPLHIPLDIELYDQQGQVIPLRMRGEPVTSVISITEAQQTLEFSDVPERPVPSLLREFSAPVKLDYPYSAQQLSLLMSHARNDFARWDAAQMLLAQEVEHNVTKVQNGQPVAFSQQLVAAIRQILQQESLDPALTAQIVALPSETEMAEWFEQIDPDAIKTVRDELMHHLATALLPLWQQRYHAINLPDYRIEQRDIALRALRNLCLKYLALAVPQQAEPWVEQQYHSANNMTDSIAALSAAIEAQLPCCEVLLQHFEQRWQQEGLVMDKWFTLQASHPAADVLSRVRTLMQHPVFSLSNPNRIRALIGAFCNHNPSAFHALDGSGYLFLEEILRDLNQRNPQIASRLIEPLIRFKRYDQQRQQLMSAVLQRLKVIDNLSIDLYEKIDKALN